MVMLYKSGITLCPPFYECIGPFFAANKALICRGTRLQKVYCVSGTKILAEDPLSLI